MKVIDDDSRSRRLSYFQMECRDLLEGILRRHAIQNDGFAIQGCENVWLRADFQFRGRPHRIELSHDMVVMWAGENTEQLFEPYMSAEFKTDRTLAEGFAARLDRYLGGGEWAGPDEGGIWELLRSKLRRLIRGRQSP
jgi:hypothetical protein